MTESPMKMGVTIFPTDTTMQPVPLARAVEDRGFESLWFPEHSHIPTSRTTPWAGNPEAPPLPDHYWRSHHQTVALGACAAVTSDLKLATGITLVAQRDPIWLAKEIASLDVISNGRAIMGVGYGWNKEELAHHGVKYTDRRAVMRERIHAMKQLWTQDEASFSGEHVNFDSSWSWPKPVQAGGPPIILGGAAGPKTTADIVDYCDGWMPIMGRYDMATGIANMRVACEESGRDPDTIELGVFGAPPKREVLESLKELGVARAVFALPQTSEADVVAALDKLAPVIGTV